MPEYDLELNSRKALVAFMDVATPEDAQSILSGKPRALSPAEIAIQGGKNDFARFGCVGCHGTELQGGVANPNAQGGEVPSLLHVSDDYTKDEVIAIIRNGRVPPVENAAGPTPPLYMPSWKQVLSEEDINHIADYLWSMQQKKKDSGRSNPLHLPGVGRLCRHAMGSLIVSVAPPCSR